MKEQAHQFVAGGRDVVLPPNLARFTELLGRVRSRRMGTSWIIWIPSTADSRPPG